MGIVRWLSRINPLVYKNAIYEITSEKISTLDDIKKILNLFEKQCEEDEIDEWDDCLSEDSEEEKNSLLIWLFLLVIEEQSWSLDKSVDPVLKKVFKELSGLEPLYKFVNFENCNIGLPKFIEESMSEEFCIWDNKDLNDYINSVNLYKTKDSLQVLTDKKLSSSIEILKEDYYWSCWQNFRDAIITTVQKGHYLGMGLSAQLYIQIYNTEDCA